MAAFREIHVRLSQACYEKLQSIADQDEASLATVCRLALWQFIKKRVSEEHPVPPVHDRHSREQ